MSFHKRHVPLVDVLKEQLDTLGIDAFMYLYTKPDALVGSQESLDFVNDAIEQYRVSDIQPKTVQ